MSRRMRWPTSPRSARRLAVLVGVIVVPRRRVAEPRESRQALALGQHVTGDAGLPGGESVRQQVALDLGDLRPVLQVEILVRLEVHLLAILRRQRSDGPLQIANRGEMLVEPHRIFLRQTLAQQRRILRAPNPGCCACG